MKAAKGRAEAKAVAMPKPRLPQQSSSPMIKLQLKQGKAVQSVISLLHAIPSIRQSR